MSLLKKEIILSNNRRNDLGLFFLPPESINSKPRSMWSVDLFMSLFCDFIFSQELDCVNTTSYFFTITTSTAWFALGFFLQGDSEPSQSEQIIGISGLFFISIVTVIEANLAFKKASNKTKAEKEKIISSEKKGWFK